MSDERIKLSVLKQSDTLNSDLYEEACLFIKHNYLQRLRVKLSTFPKTIIVAINQQNEIVSALGFNSGKETNPLLLESYFDFNVLEKLTGKKTSHRSLAEVGSLSIKNGYANKFKLTTILTAVITLFAKKHDHDWVVLTTLPNIQVIANPLKVTATYIGKPEILNKPKEFQDNWAYYFSLQPTSVGFNVHQAEPGCLDFLDNCHDFIDYQSVLS